MEAKLHQPDELGSDPGFVEQTYCEMQICLNSECCGTVGPPHPLCGRLRVIFWPWKLFLRLAKRAQTGPPDHSQSTTFSWFSLMRFKILNLFNNERPGRAKHPGEAREKKNHRTDGIENVDKEQKMRLGTNHSSKTRCVWRSRWSGSAAFPARRKNSRKPTIVMSPQEWLGPQPPSRTASSPALQFKMAWMNPVTSS